jgi:hypothetical protein
VLPPSSELKNKLSKQQAEQFLGLFFDSEDGGNMFFQNICKILPDWI